MATTPYYPIYLLLSVAWSLVGGQRQNKISNFKPYKWSRSLTRGGRLQEVPNILISLENFWYFGKLVALEVVAYERWVRLYIPKMRFKLLRIQWNLRLQPPLVSDCENFQS